MFIGANELGITGWLLNGVTEQILIISLIEREYPVPFNTVSRKVEIIPHQGTITTM